MPKRGSAGRIFGDTSSLKASHAETLERLATRAIPPIHVVGPMLARELLELAHELNRRVGVFIDRRGRVVQVMLGTTHSLQLPEFNRVRGADGRLRGVRLVLTHLVPEPLDREELADLAKLRLDLLAAIHRGPAGISIDVAALEPAPAGHAQVFRTVACPRVPLAVLTRDEPNPEHEDEHTPHLPAPADVFIHEHESALVSSTARARMEVRGVRAMVLMVHQGGEVAQARRAEMEELCRTADVALMALEEQRRSYPDPRTFFGSGKLQQVLVHALEQDVELLICDPELSASQARTIATRTDLKVIDRTMLILDIFAKHAKSADGKLQVELAQLRYNLPKMVGKGTMMSRLAGGIGGQGPGETKLEIDRRRARDRIADLERRLQKLRNRREQKRALRRRHEVPTVAIVGYTNAGKSTLLNTVTGSVVDSQDKLFATLDPTVRRIRFPREREVVLLDTVGFIRDLPPALMQAFSATLEEVAESDLLLHVVDATDPDQMQQIQTVEAILGELGAAQVPRFLVFNKCDRLDPQDPEIAGPQRDSARPDVTQSFHISARERRTTQPLVAAIERHLWAHGRIDHETSLPTPTTDTAMNP